ncbi:MAG: PstS family phosphate ABC transporter substrate-binding protein [Methanosarcinales archaeon]|nr:PstS family phosphate ABC transporter substrate-binding protein [Methanosarcinales archaeon]
MNKYSGILIIIVTAITFGCIGQQPGESLDIKGSDTLVQVVSDMAETYMDNNPGTEVVVTGGGSGTGIAAIINGEIDIADSSRQIKAEEIDQAKAKGIEPWEFIIARDGLAVIVNPDNPLTNLTLDQIGAIYRGEINNWNQIGGNDIEITIYGRQSTSGTYEFLLEHVVNWQQTQKKDYSPRMLNMEGNRAIVDTVMADASGIGYVGIGYVTNEISVINVAWDEASEYITPLDEENIENGLYPITRPLYQYTSDKPDKDSPVYDFLKFELSEAGQDVVQRAGFYPINMDDRVRNQEKISK